MVGHSDLQKTHFKATIRLFYIDLWLGLGWDEITPSRYLNGGLNAISEGY
jgi:hypothetical protein